MAESTAIGGHVKELSDKYPGNFISSKSGKVRVYHLDHAGAKLFSEDQLSEAQEALSRLSINPHRYVLHLRKPCVQQSRACSDELMLTN